MPSIIQTCRRCGKEFKVRASWLKQAGYDYCSKECRWPPLIRVCHGCGTEFKSYASRKQKKYFCNSQCRMSEESQAKRFWEQVKIIDDATSCWIWTGLRNTKGYGHFMFNEVHTFAHRIVYGYTFPDFDKSLHVCHHCDNPPCCRPDHLFLGTNDDNVRDKIAKNRQSAKITSEKVRDIRKLYATGQYTMKDLGQTFGVGLTQISRIVNRVRWTHVD